MRRLVNQMQICQNLVTKFEYGTRLREDSSRKIVKNNLSLKLISRKIGIQEMANRLISEEFDLVQKITSTKRNSERTVQKRLFKKYFGVGSQFGPYKVNSGKRDEGK